MEHNTLDRLHAAGIALDRGGTLSYWSRRRYAATGLAVSAIFRNQKQAEWFFAHDIACSEVALQDLENMLRRDTSTWPISWFERRIARYGHDRDSGGSAAEMPQARP